MPGGDRTGPSGKGPLTGRGAGYCTGSESPGFMSSVRRRFPGTGRTVYGGTERPLPSRRVGRGRGRGFGRRMFGG
ncbi:MAG: DUF5320 domain-containing protein [Actinobacteria bacterium]|nr:DUF5320 domain-containing protein [Actinomycetota bacterium]